jgi:hypothetical protein
MSKELERQPEPKGDGMERDNHVSTDMKNKNMQPDSVYKRETGKQAYILEEDPNNCRAMDLNPTSNYIEWLENKFVKRELAMRGKHTSCKTCKYMTVNEEHSEVHECRRYAPRKIHGVGTGYEGDLFPEVSLDCWCGEWEHRKL